MTKMKLQVNMDTLIKEINFLRNLFEVRMQERGRDDAFRCEPGTFGAQPRRLWMSLEVKPLVAAQQGGLQTCDSLNVWGKLATHAF